MLLIPEFRTESILIRSGKGAFRSFPVRRWPGRKALGVAPLPFYRAHPQKKWFWAKNKENLFFFCSKFSWGATASPRWSPLVRIRPSIYKNIRAENFQNWIWNLILVGTKDVRALGIIKYKFLINDCVKIYPPYVSGRPLLLPLGGHCQGLRHA